MTQLQKHLRNIRACTAGLEFADDRTASEVWETCVRPDWLGWWLTKTNTESENRRVGKLYCRIWMEDIGPLMPESEQLPFCAMLEAVAGWCEQPTEEARKKAIALARALALDLALAIALGRALGLDLALARDLDLALDKKWCDAIRAEFNCPFKETT